jgi:ubiquinone biosynthesis protein COQ4
MLRSAVVRSKTLFSSTRGYGCSILLVPKDSRTFSVLNRPKPNYPGHVPLNMLEKGFLGIGSGIGALWNPRRAGTLLSTPTFSSPIAYCRCADLVGSFAEVTAGPFLEHLRDAMLSDETGRRILRDRPKINSETMPIERLRACPENTVGRYMAEYLDQNGMSLDERDDVKYVDDQECAYVMLRYRQTHDFGHALTGLPAAFIEGEVALKAFEFFNTGLPMAGLSLGYVAKLKPDERSRFFKIYLPWAFKNGLKSKLFANVYWEEELRTPVDRLRNKLGIEKPPDVRELRMADRRRMAKEGH